MSNFGSQTPINTDQRDALRAGLAELVSTFCSALRKYKREDQEQSNRVRPAEQILVTAEALLKTLRADEAAFLPTLMEDYVETLALSRQEDAQAFEATDAALFAKVIERARVLYAYYPEIEESSDPANTRFITEDFPYSLAQLETELKDVVYSDHGWTHFSDTTRELIEAEINASVPRTQDSEKTKLARLGALVGEMQREMSKYADRLSNGANRVAAWVKTYEKVEKMWKKIEPWLGTPPDV